MLFKHLKVFSMYSIHLKVYTSCHLELDATDHLVNTLQSHYNLRQHSCKPRVLSFHVTLPQLECDDVPTGCHRRELPQNELALFSGRAIAGVAPEAPAQAHNGRQAHLVHYLFESLRSHSQHDGPVCRPSPAPFVSRKGSQSCGKGVCGDERWLRRRSLNLGPCPLQATNSVPQISHGSSRLTCLASFCVQYKSTSTDQAEDALDAHGNADLKIGPPVRIECFNALREIQRGHYKSTMLTLLGAQFTCFTVTKVQIIVY